MDNEIQLITDGDGVAVIGDPTAIERFLEAEGLPSKELGLQRLDSLLSTAAGATQAASAVAANSGRWVKLTEQSAQALKVGDLMKGSEPGFRRAVLMEKGRTKGILEIVRTPGAAATNPAFLAGAAGLMAQLAMQQTMNEITDYLATIDQKVDDVLRAQKDGVLADMIGVDFVIEEVMTIREQVGRVSEVSWSKVQATAVTIARTQAYALSQLNGLAERMERETKIGGIADRAKEAEAKVQEWLAVLARCFQLQEAMAVLELDRVLDASPLELDQHRRALQAARRNRLELISRSTAQLMTRMDAAAGMANTKVLLHPTTSRDVVHSSNYVAGAVDDFHGRLGIEGGRQATDARRWTDAATEARDKALGRGAGGVDATKRLGNETLDRAKTARGKVSSQFAERTRRRSKDDEAPNEEG